MGKSLPASLIAGVRRPFRSSSTAGSSAKTLSNGLRLTVAAPLHQRSFSFSRSRIYRNHTLISLESRGGALPPSRMIANVAAGQHRGFSLQGEEANAENRDMEGPLLYSPTKAVEATCSESSSQQFERQDWPNLRKLTPGEFLYEQVSAYQKHFSPLLEAERGEETTRIQERIGQWSLDHLVAEGYTLVDLSAAPYSKPKEPHDGYTFSFVPPAGELMGDNLFTRSQNVTVVPNSRSPLGYYSKNSSEASLETVPHGIVVHASPEEIRVKFSIMNLKFSPNQLWRLDLSASDIAYQRIQAALECLHYNPAEIEQNSSEGEFRVKGTALREPLLRSWPTPESTYMDSSQLATANSSPLLDNASILDWADRHSTIPPVQKEGDPVITLNASQTQAIALMFKERLSLVQGPPGTGKTRTIIEALRILKSHFKLHHPLLVCTYTNVAVDNLVEGFAGDSRSGPTVGFPIW